MTFLRLLMAVVFEQLLTASALTWSRDDLPGAARRPSSSEEGKNLRRPLPWFRCAPFYSSSLLTTS